MAHTVDNAGPKKVRRTPKIIFACKSNTCRSQMAEGWGNAWIQKRNVQMRQESSERPVLSSCSGSDRGVTPTSSPNVQVNIHVGSVALNDSSVYEPSSSSKCCGDICDTTFEKKVVKAKAVETMALDGVDISSCVPKTFQDLDILPPSTEKNRSSSTFTEMGEDRKSIDKLVILCACTDEINEDLINSAKSVEEWNVDAPTAAEKSGEVNAYRRVSHEIKVRVDSLMQRMFNDIVLHEEKLRENIQIAGDETNALSEGKVEC
eukprot:CAMPEP_0195523316 /NCGR_PEP_ID=MMETSP0794_2-20130614/22326_1 /TAXON_ID=515487 /ORGANISM="Stephanopyxis turris, Strain CCMP 815" /LENGTH=261 /DNA_ID=CAMNT_0040653285 /DNA_START=72 /DNA_END=857 /DNA_ORIENTATION=-